MLTSLISSQTFSAQLSAYAVSDNELDARAESIRRLAESIQVKVSGETFVFSQFKDNKATQELVDSVKTSTDLTLLGVEVFLMKTKQGYRAEAQIDTEKSFNLYLTKIKAEKQLLDNKIVFFHQQKTKLGKFSYANELIPQLSAHLEDYLLATMLSVKPQINKIAQIPQWMTDLSKKSQSLLVMSDFVKQLASSTITEPQLAALMLVNGIAHENVYICPILQTDGSWLQPNQRLHLEINKLLALSAQSKETAQYFFIGHADKNEQNTSSISYQLFDTSGKALQKNQVNYSLTRPVWQTQPTRKNSVLTSIKYEFKDKTGKLIPENITTKKQLYTLVEQNILNENYLIVVDPCKPVSQLSPYALTNAYGVTSLISISIAGSLSTFTLRPDPKEHEFAQAKISYTKQDLNELNKIKNKTSLGKKFPVLTPESALISAVETALKKFNK